MTDIPPDEIFCAGLKWTNCSGLHRAYARNSAIKCYRPETLNGWVLEASTLGKMPGFGNIIHLSHYGDYAGTLDGNKGRSVSVCVSDATLPAALAQLDGVTPELLGLSWYPRMP